ncbi:uncharacterized protein LOC110209830 [Phascolarctos cinereus]
MRGVRAPSYWRSCSRLKSRFFMRGSAAAGLSRLAPAPAPSPRRPQRTHSRISPPPPPPPSLPPPPAGHSAQPPPPSAPPAGASPPSLLPLLSPSPPGVPSFKSPSPAAITARPRARPLPRPSDDCRPMATREGRDRGRVTTAREGAGWGRWPGPPPLEPSPPPRRSRTPRHPTPPTSPHASLLSFLSPWGGEVGRWNRGASTACREDGAGHGLEMRSATRPSSLSGPTPPLPPEGNLLLRTRSLSHPSLPHFPVGLALAQVGNLGALRPLREAGRHGNEGVGISSSACPCPPLYRRGNRGPGGPSDFNGAVRRSHVRGLHSHSFNARCPKASGRAVLPRGPLGTPPATRQAFAPAVSRPRVPSLLAAAFQNPGVQPQPRWSVSRLRAGLALVPAVPACAPHRPGRPLLPIWRLCCCICAPRPRCV